MSKTHCLLAHVALCVGLAQSSSWDFATASGNNLEFYLEGTQTYTENITTTDIGKMTYDPVGNRLFFYDDGYTANFILSYDMTTKKTEAVVPRFHDTDRIEGIAYDPVEKILFWNEYFDLNIYWLSLKPGFENNAYGNILIQTSDQGTATIAIDSCKRYIYWTSIDEVGNKLPSLIERARFDGSDKEVVIGNNLQKPERLVVDHQTQKLYWTDGPSANKDMPAKDRYFTIESADLNGKNRRVLYRGTRQYQPMSLAVSDDSIYWSHYSQRNAWKLPKNSSTHVTPKEIPIGAWYEIVANYKIEQQIRGVHDCDRLKSVLENNSTAQENVSLDVTNDISLRDVTVCQNYCFRGVCSVNDEGKPQCRCNGDYSGIRCEVNVCRGYCLNDGVCSLTEAKQPECQCRSDYGGERCEVSACLNRLNKHFQTVAMLGAVLNADVASGTPARGVKSTCASTVF